MASVGHTLSSYLPRSETFIYTQLRFQRSFRPVVLATHVTNLAEFPFAPVVQLLRGGPGGRRLRRLIRTLASGGLRGYRQAYDRRLTSEARRHRCVLLHSHFGWMGVEALVARERLGVPLVTTFYGKDLAAPPEFYQRLFSEGELFFCEGPAMAHRLGALGCPDEKIRIVRIGLDLDHFPFAARSTARPLVVVQACRFVEKKGVDLSIRAYAAARSQLGDSELWLIGDGPLRTELESLARELGVSRSVRFLGMLSHTEYRRVMDRAHIGIQPSRTAADGDTEGGAPTTILEMLAIGVPVVATRHADIPFVVPDPERLAEENDAEGLAAALLQHARLAPGERSALVQTGRELIEAHHDARAVAGSVEDLYEEALGRKRGSGLIAGKRSSMRCSDADQRPVDPATPFVRREYLVFGRPVIHEAEIDEVVSSLRSGWIGTGPKVARLERMLEDYLAVPHVRCVSSCTAALILAMHVVGIGRGDEVIVPAMTFVASANAVEHMGATPVLVDCEPKTGLMDLDAAEAAIGPRTRAIMPVHFAGRPVDMDRMNALRDKYGLVVVEDAAHAIGAAWRGGKIGAHGNLVAFSFYVTKNITTVEGGALATDSSEVAEQVERRALHGLSLGAWQRFSDAGFKHYEVEQPGFKFNMTDLQASLGIHQLPRLDGWIERRALLFDQYDELLAGLPLTTPPPAHEGSVHARHLYQILLEDEAQIGRDELGAFLHSRRIGTGIHYRGVHLHEYYRRRYGIDPRALPVATDMSERTLSLPMSPALAEADLHDVGDAVRDALAGDRGELAPASSSGRTARE